MKSRAGYWLGGGLIVVGIAGALVWMVVLLLGVSFNIDGWLRVGVPANASVQLEARDYVVYYESAAAADEPVPSVRVQVFDAQTGAEVPIAPYRGHSLTTSAARGRLWARSRHRAAGCTGS